MPHAPSTPRLAIGQLHMHWTIEANMRSILGTIELAHARGANVCSFPELAVTGFHREIVSLAKKEIVFPQVQRLQEVCARWSIAIAVGAPTFGAEQTKFNSHLFINELGELVGVVSKIGLIAPEATFFSPGTERPVALMHGVRCSAVICREIEDNALVREQLSPGGVDLLFWPGQMRPDPEKPVVEPPEHVVQAQELAQALEAYVIQANWPNALNRPEEGEHAGHSAVIAPTGELLFRLPKQAPGLAVFSLGEANYEWHPGEA